MEPRWDGQLNPADAQRLSTRDGARRWTNLITTTGVHGDHDYHQHQHQHQPQQHVSKSPSKVVILFETDQISVILEIQGHCLITHMLM